MVVAAVGSGVWVSSSGPGPKLAAKRGSGNGRTLAEREAVDSPVFDRSGATRFFSTTCCSTHCLGPRVPVLPFQPIRPRLGGGGWTRRRPLGGRPGRRSFRRRLGFPARSASWPSRSIHRIPLGAWHALASLVQVATHTNCIQPYNARRCRAGPSIVDNPSVFQQIASHRAVRLGAGT
jgi:hypothetical protein